MITKQEYQRLKEICKSSNPDDVKMIGPMILSLRNKKQLKMRMVNELYSLSIQTLKLDVKDFTKNEIRLYSKLVWHTSSKSFFNRITYKWKWLNGEL